MTNTSTSIEPRKRPRQTRSSVTFDAILEATAHILENDGLGVLNTNAIAKRTGISIGSFYQYFPTKEAVLAEIIRRKRKSLLEGMIRVSTGREEQSFGLTIRRLVEVTVRHQTDKPKFVRALEYACEVLPLQGETDNLNKKIVDVIQEVLQEQSIPEAEEAARDIVAIVKGMVESASFHGEVHQPAVIDRICRAVCGYLAVDCA